MIGRKGGRRILYLRKNAEIVRSKEIISIRGSDFSRFTLNLTQVILDIQNDNISELQSKEQSRIVKISEAIKEKSVDVSKGSIERGVKNHKRAERNRGDSDFVYPK